MWPRVAAALAGVCAAGAALYILIGDALETGIWPLEAKLMPVVVVVTVITGHLFGVSLRQLRLLSALGFGIMATTGVGMTVLSSASRQIQSTDAKVLSATEVNDRIAEEEKKLKQNQAMLDDARAKMASECPRYSTSHCNRIERTVKVYEDAVKGNQAELRRLGPQHSVDHTADRVADAVKMFGGDGASVKAVLTTFKPFLWALFLELTSILCLGFALAGSQRWKPTVEANPPPPPEKDGKQPLAANPPPTPKTTVGSQPLAANLWSPPGGHLRLVHSDAFEGVGCQPVPTPVIVNFPTVEANPEIQRLATLAAMAENGVVCQPQTELAATLGFQSRQAVRTWLKQMEAKGEIELSTSPKGTVVKILFTP